MPRMADSSAAIRAGTKARDTSRRSRVWSGGSTLSMCRENSGPGRPSATTSPIVLAGRRACPWRCAGR